MINENLANDSSVSNKKLTNTDIELNINYNGTILTVSARDLYNKLGLNKTNISRWLDKNIINNEFAIEGEDYMGFVIMTNGNEVKDYKISIDFAKKLCMMARTSQGERVRQYFLKCEEKARNPFNVPTSFKEALKLALEQQEEIEKKNQLLIERDRQIEEQKPKVLFADSVESSKNTILIGELAKILKQNGIDIGQKRLFEWLRNNDYLMKFGSSKNKPTQRAMDMGLFEIKETSVVHSDGHTTINITTKVTGKGQVYFINKFLNKEKEE